MGTDERSWHDSLAALFETFPKIPLLCSSSDRMAASEDAKFLNTFKVSFQAFEQSNPFGSNLKETRMRNRNRIIRSNDCYAIVHPPQSIDDASL
jgi:hypothetical protein